MKLAYVILAALSLNIATASAKPQVDPAKLSACGAIVTAKDDQFVALKRSHLKQITEIMSGGVTADEQVAMEKIDAEMTLLNELESAEANRLLQTCLKL